MTYDEAMRALNAAIYDAVRAANNEDGAPAAALREIAADIDSLVDTGLTPYIRRESARYRAEYKNARALYDGAKLAGLTQ